jgi:Asp-tRNA(Asn)/Glu-tRNA(Gln) amidotransferase A subunit family amidase
MARSVSDLALFDSIITGDAAPIQPAALKGVRIGVPRGVFYENLDASLAPVIETALTRLRQAGCVLVEAEIPDVEKLFGAAILPVTFYEMPRDVSRYLEESGAKITIKELAAQIASPDVKPPFDTFAFGPRAITQEAYDAAIKQTRPAYQAAYRDYFRSHDLAAIVYPTTILPARPIGDDAEVELNGKKVPTFATFTRNARLNTMAGIPGLSLPVGLTAAGLPVGLELDAPQGEDRRLLSLGLAVEALFEKLPPPLG